MIDKSKSKKVSGISQDSELMRFGHTVTLCNYLLTK